MKNHGENNCNINQNNNNNLNLKKQTNKNEKQIQGQHDELIYVKLQQNYKSKWRNTLNKNAHIQE